MQYSTPTVNEDPGPFSQRIIFSESESQEFEIDNQNADIGCVFIMQPSNMANVLFLILFTEDLFPEDCLELKLSI